MTEALQEQLAITMNKIAQGQVEIVSGIAVEVDEQKNTFTLHREGFTKNKNVRINAITDIACRYSVIPKEGSAVIVGLIDKTTQAVLLQTSKVQALRINIDKYNIVINEKGILMANDTDNLLTLYLN